MKRLISAALLAALLCLTGCGAAQPPGPDLSAAPPPAAPRLVVLDPGHQAHADTTPEPIGPGASETKMRVTGGAVGVVTGTPEHALVLTVAKQLRAELEGRGYAVLLTREEADVDLSNRERAVFANEAGADVFLRLHANGSTGPTAHGVMTICPTAESPYPIGMRYEECRLLADCVLDAVIDAAGAARDRLWETDSMAGLNWAEVPTTLVELGYLTDPDEDRLLSDPAYQAKLVQGLADGIDRYFVALEKSE